MNPNEEYYSIAEFAKILNVHYHTIRRAIISGKLQAIKLGTEKKAFYRIAKSELERMALFDLEKLLDKMAEKIVEKKEKEINRM